MGRGLSPQQRAILALAYDRHQRREELARAQAEELARLEAILGPPPAGRGPQSPAETLFYGDALLALHGWCYGRAERDWSDRRYRLGTDSIGVSSRYLWREGEAERVLDVAAYRTAHASTARTLARLVARGYLARGRWRGGYRLTDAGAQLAAQLWPDHAEAC